MRAFVLTAPHRAEVEDVPEPVAAPGEAVVDVERVGVCGTDVAFFNGTMPFLHDGNATFPMRLGHEWAGVVSAVGSSSDQQWIGRRVVGDTMLGDGTCRRCRRGSQHTCANRTEVGVKGGRDGALAERLAVPVTSLHELPDSVDSAVGALVEPGANSFRAAEAAQLGPEDRVLVLGLGTIGLGAAMFARATGAEVHLMGRSPGSLDLARSLGFEHVWTAAHLPGLPFDAVIDASNSPALPARALELVEPGGRVVYIGLAGSPSEIDTRTMVFNVKATGVLSGSPRMGATIDAFAAGTVDPRPLIAATVSLDQVADVLAGRYAAGPKIQVDPRR